MVRQSDEIKVGKSWFDDAELSSSKHDDILIWLHNKIKTTDLLHSLLVKEKFDFIGLCAIEIEKPILFSCGGKDKTPKGFIDLWVSFAILDKERHGKPILTWDGGKSFDTGEKYDGNSKMELCFEIKSKVNIGETIRQIKYYGSGLWYVCAPDFPQKHLLYENGIGFVPYEP